MRSSKSSGRRIQDLADQLAQAQTRGQAEARTVASQLSCELAKAFARRPASDLAEERFGRWEAGVQQPKDDRLTHGACTPEQTSVSASDGTRDEGRLPTSGEASEETSFTLADLNVLAEKGRRYELLLLIQRLADSGCPRARAELRRHVARHYGEYLDAWGQLRGGPAPQALSKPDADAPACHGPNGCAEKPRSSRGQQRQPGGLRGEVGVLRGEVGVLRGEVGAMQE